MGFIHTQRNERKTMRNTSIPLLLVGFVALQSVCARQAFADDREEEVGVQAYIYAYPMILMEVTRRVSTNVAQLTYLRAPMNQFAHAPAFPDHTFREVVRPNADTLYSILWFDVSMEPVVVSIPDTAGRYYMLPMLDMWTDIFAAPGSRTSGTGEAHYAIVGPGWEGSLPYDVEPIRSPTSMGWMIGRTQTNGAADYSNVHRIQEGYRVTPRSRWRRPYTPPADSPVNSSWDMKTPPPVQTDQMSAEEYFELFAELLKKNPPHELDWNMVALLRQIGIVPGEDLDFSELPRDTQRALERALPLGRRMIEEKATRAGESVNGWLIARELMGNYGTSYLQRAYIARVGLGANVPEDAVYPMSVVDGNGETYNGRHRYVLHFDDAPPVNGFWSLAMYDSEGYFVDNPIARYSIGDRDELKFDSDGSVEICIQHDSPGPDKESNWLPAPKGEFNLVLRLYRPGTGILTGAWNPPTVRRVQ